ncbi:hypothetical protein H0Z60_11295 [Ectothiorhodospiraceae bacterium WFHF3C12]|nr:hypothetical protein [Ectothiorhodospiraceae bacterium WFHF3C12]
MVSATAKRWMTALALLALAAAAGAQTMGEHVRITRPAEADSYLLGRSVLVEAPVAGDVVAAGQDVTLGSEVAEDVIAAAEQLTVSGRIADDLRGLARRLDVSGRVHGHAVLAGWRVHLAEGSQVGDWFWGTGAEIRLDGVVVGDVRLRAAEVIIGGAIGGDTEIVADSVTVLPGASFAGDLRIRSEQPVNVPDGVNIGGVFSQSRLSAPSAAEGDGDGGFTGWVLVAVFVLVLLFLLPRSTRGTVALLRERPLASLGLGLAILAAGPLLGILLVASGLGALLGLAWLLVYLLLLIAGVHAGVSTLADGCLEMLGRRPLAGWRGAVAVIAAVLVVALVSWIPWLGPLLLFLGLLAGVGASGLGLWRWRFG